MPEVTMDESLQISSHGSFEEPRSSPVDRPLIAVDEGLVRLLIERTHRFHADAPTDPDDPLAEELCRMLARLNGDQLAEILALIGLGRGDFPLSCWSERRCDSPWRDARWTLDELFATTTAVGHLEDGLAKLARGA